MANLGHIFLGRRRGMRVLLLISFLSHPDVSQGWPRSHTGPLKVLCGGRELPVWESREECPHPPAFLHTGTLDTHPSRPKQIWHAQIIP